jgi:hypothetical protein
MDPIKMFGPLTREKFRDSSFEVSSMKDRNSMKSRPRLITNPVATPRDRLLSLKLDELQEGFEIPFNESGDKLLQTISLKLSGSLPSVANLDSADDVFEIPFDEAAEGDKHFGNFRAESQVQPIHHYMTKTVNIEDTEVGDCKEVDHCKADLTGLTIKQPANYNSKYYENNLYKVVSNQNSEISNEVAVASPPFNTDASTGVHLAPSDETNRPSSSPGSVDKIVDILTSRITHNSQLLQRKTGVQRPDTTGITQNKYKKLLDKQKKKPNQIVNWNSHAPPCEIVTSPKNENLYKTRPSFLPSPKRFLSHSISTTSSISSASSVEEEQQ